MSTSSGLRGVGIVRVGTLQLSRRGRPRLSRSYGTSGATGGAARIGDSSAVGLRDDARLQTRRAMDVALLTRTVATAPDSLADEPTQQRERHPG